MCFVSLREKVCLNEEASAAPPEMHRVGRELHAEIDRHGDDFPVVGIPGAGTGGEVSFDDPGHSVANGEHSPAEL